MSSLRTAPLITLAENLTQLQSIPTFHVFPNFLEKLKLQPKKGSNLIAIDHIPPATTEIYRNNRILLSKIHNFHFWLKTDKSSNISKFLNHTKFYAASEVNNLDLT